MTYLVCERRLEIVSTRRAVGRKLQGFTCFRIGIGIDNDVGFGDLSRVGIIEDARSRRRVSLRKKSDVLLSRGNSDQTYAITFIGWANGLAF